MANAEKRPTYNGADRHNRNADTRRLRRILIVSVLFHAMAVPPALYVLGIVGEPDQLPQREVVLEVEKTRKKARVRPLVRPIVEPSRIEPPPFRARPIPILDEPLPDIPLMYERPSIEPVTVSLTPFKSHSGTTAAGSGHAHLPLPPSEPAGNEQPEPALEPEAPRYPEAPPAEILNGLPRGGVEADSGEPIFQRDSRDELLKRVYAGSGYPDEALDLGLEGEVVVRFKLDAAGKPRNIAAVDSCEEMALLEEQAVQMVREGGPYPVPLIRKTVEIRGATAFLNTGSDTPDKVLLVRSTGNAKLDAALRKLALRDAAGKGPGWHVRSYEARAIADFHPGGLKPPVLRSVEGDKRLAPFLEKHLEHLVAAPNHTGYLRVPIHFRIVEP